MDEDYNADVERWWATPAPDVVPIGVPGVQRPSEISGHQTVWHGPKDKVRPAFCSAPRATDRAVPLPAD